METPCLVSPSGKHCWHYTDYVPHTHPPMSERRCCFCKVLQFVYDSFGHVATINVFVQYLVSSTPGPTLVTGSGLH